MMMMIRLCAASVKYCRSLSRFSSSASYKPPFANDPEDYQKLVKMTNLKRRQFLESPTRFQSISKRHDKTDNPLSMHPLRNEGKVKHLYRGLVVFKCPEEYVIYHQLFWEVKPATVIELGSNTGGFALWVADTLKLMNVPASIYSMDISLSSLSPETLDLKPNNVKFLQGDCYNIKKTFTPEMLKSFPHPWVVIDDAHANVPNVLEYFHRYTELGDYVIVEDTDPTFVPRIGDTKRNEVSDDGIGPELLNQLKMFLQKYEDYYAIDSFLNDMFGYNSTNNWNGFIRRMK